MTAPQSTPRLLFVCLGNICRSPTAEGVMRVLAPDWVIDSAGTGNWHLGDPPHPPAVAAAAVRGYDLAHLRARQIAVADFAAFDRIVVMDAGNLRDVLALRPVDSRTPVTRLLDHVDGVEVVDVPDPYYTGDFEQALDLIEAGCRGLLRDVSG